MPKEASSERGHCQLLTTVVSEIGLATQASSQAPSQERAEEEELQPESPDLTASPVVTSPVLVTWGRKEKPHTASDPALSPDHNDPVLELSRNMGTPEL